jgi:hypothetical protein
MTAIVTDKQIKEFLAFRVEANRLETAEMLPLRDWVRVMPTKQSFRLLAAPNSTSFDEETQTAIAVLSKGTPVKRAYGTEVLRISRDAAILTRVKNGGIPLLDSHIQVGIASSLGRVTDVWIENSVLIGKLKFHATDEGAKAGGMVARGEIVGVSVGYRVEEWEITDQFGRVLDPEVDRVRADDELKFEAIRWELLECSLVTVPADPMARIRSDYDQPFAPGIGEKAAAAARARMRMRQEIASRSIAAARASADANADALARMKSRQAMHDRMAAARR